MGVSVSMADIGGLVASGEDAKAAPLPPPAPVVLPNARSEESEGGSTLSVPGENARAVVGVAAAADVGGTVGVAGVGILPLLSPPGGLVADGVSGGGALGELNSAQRGHFRFVSAKGVWVSYLCFTYGKR
jgi:hypothetical protein